MKSQADLGIVLKRTVHLDEDARLTVLLRDLGKVVVLAKGIQRVSAKLKGVKEPFCEADLQVALPPNGVYARLLNGRLIDSHIHIRQNYDAFTYASRCCEVVDMLLPHRSPTPDVYDILKFSLENMKPPHDPRFTWVVFVSRLFKTMGHGDMSSALGPVTEATIGRCLGLVESQLERVLPWRLKSHVLAQQP